VTAALRVASWLAGRSSRERALLLGATVAMVGLGAVGAGLAARDDLAALRARVAAHERELVEVRRLATLLARAPATNPPAAADAPSLLTRLEVAAADTVGHERIASMTPAATSGPAVPGTERVALRIAGASLAEVVRLLHDLETGDPPLAVTRLELRKHPDDATRFDATVEVGAEPPS
jgi:hypothetical protein